MADQIETAAETAEKPTQASTDAVKAGGDKADQAATSQKSDSKPARTAKAAKAPAKRAATASRKTRKTNTDRKAKAKRAARIAPAAAEPVINERKSNVNFDKNQWFAGFGALPASPFQSMFADAGERSQDVVRRSQQIAEEMADLTRENVEALTESARIAAEGARNLGQDVVESSRESLESAADAVRGMAEAKSATEFVQRQGDYARASFDRMVSQSSRLTESFVKLAGEAFQPLSSRASVNAERLNTFVA